MQTKHIEINWTHDGNDDDWKRVSNLKLFSSLKIALQLNSFYHLLCAFDTATVN